MLTAGIIVGVVVVASCCYLAYLAITAPEGYEDDTGFHLGRKDEE